MTMIVATAFAGGGFCRR